MGEDSAAPTQDPSILKQRQEQAKVRMEGFGSVGAGSGDSAQRQRSPYTLVFEIRARRRELQQRRETLDQQIGILTALLDTFEG